MMDRLIYKIANKAFQSEFYRFILSRILSFAVPFNSPHRLRIKELDRGYAKVRLPFIRSNRNHVNSVHACALATLCEFTCGISIMTLLSSDQYRIVLKSLQMEYQYRGRGDVLCDHRLDPNAFLQLHGSTLQSGLPLLYETAAKVYDLEGNIICIGKALWQIKKWDSVKSS
ncbi:MAG: DUF4442 domain-containing protein [Bacteroidota bacterium]